MTHKKSVGISFRKSLTCYIFFLICNYFYIIKNWGNLDIVKILFFSRVGMHKSIKNQNASSVTNHNQCIVAAYCRLWGFIPFHTNRKVEIAIQTAKACTKKTCRVSVRSEKYGRSVCYTAKYLVLRLVRIRRRSLTKRSLFYMADACFE